MPFLDDLRSARQSAASALQWFLIEHPKSPNGVFIFLENHDDPSFYSNFILKFLQSPDILKIYKCGNKNEVYKAHQRIMPKINNDCITLFFVDKDLSDILQENRMQADNIYVTDWYSIENYLVSEEMFLRVWNEFFRFNFQGNTIDFGTFRGRFQDELVNFYKYITPIMAWIIYLRRNGYRPNLNNIRLSRLYTFNDELEIVRGRDMEANGERTLLERMCDVITPTGCDSDIEAIIKELSALEPKLFVRGKFELWFFVKLIGKLALLLRSTISQMGGSLTVTMEITESNAIDVLAPRLPIPPSLTEFLRKNLSLQQN